MTLLCPCWNTFENLSFNYRASAYVSKRKSVIVPLVLVSGGIHPALVLVSSGIFGFEILYSGMSRFELQEFFGLRILFTTFLEVIFKILCIYISHFQFFCAFFFIFCFID